MKHLKVFEDYNNSAKFDIDEDIVMDTLSNLKDDNKYDVEVRVLNSYANRPCRECRIRLNNHWSYNDGADYDFMKLLYGTIQQMLNNYYNETGDEIYFVLFEAAPFSESRLLIFYLYKDLKQLNYNCHIITKDNKTSFPKPFYLT